MYQDFAHVYDRLMQDVDYAGWADFYRDTLLSLGVPKGGRVTECACGTGNLTIPLAQHFAMTGVDLSEDMLSIAQAKARQHGKLLSFIRQDMTRLTLHRRQDAVLCTCDGINYLTTDAMLRRFAEAAFQSLKPGGALMLDFSSRYKLSAVLGNNTLTFSGDDIAYIWQNAWQEKESKVRLWLDVFVKENGHYRRLQEEQTQRAHDPDALRQVFADAGFDDIAFWGDRKPTITEQEMRLHMTARRIA